MAWVNSGLFCLPLVALFLRMLPSTGVSQFLILRKDYGA